MQLGPGQMIVAEGTRLQLEGPIQWYISDEGSLLNHGVIDLGEEAALLEEPFNPVTGSGVEIAHRTFATPFAFTTPGGLGLEVASLAPIGSFTLTRGHQPIVIDPDEGVQSVARWFRIEAPPFDGAFLDLRYHYDPTELNGLVHDMLMLHGANDPEGPWSPLGGIPYPGTQTVAAWYYSPWGLVTAFHFNVVTEVPEEVSDVGFLLWPTLATEQVHLRALGSEPIRQLELFNAAGHRVGLPRQPMGAAQEMTFATQHLPAGLYVLRINGAHHQRFIKP